MTPDLAQRRSALLILYHRYLTADRDWRLAQREALAWFPSGARPSVAPIGDPGSRLRRLYDRRDRALGQLAVARLKLKTAQARTVRRIRVLALPPG